MKKLKLATTLSGRRVHLTEDNKKTLCAEEVYRSVKEDDLRGRKICTACEHKQEAEAAA